MQTHAETWQDMPEHVLCLPRLYHKHTKTDQRKANRSQGCQSGTKHAKTLPKHAKYILGYKYLPKQPKMPSHAKGTLMRAQAEQQYAHTNPANTKFCWSTWQHEHIPKHASSKACHNIATVFSKHPKQTKQFKTHTHTQAAQTFLNISLHAKTPYPNRPDHPECANAQQRAPEHVQTHTTYSVGIPNKSNTVKHAS